MASDFGAQSLFKDIINGIFILIENQFNVGDTVKLASLTGTVEDLTLRMTTLRDGDGTLYFIPNSQITTVSNLSRDFAVGTLNVSVDATADPDPVLRVLRATALAVRNDPAPVQGRRGRRSRRLPGVDGISGRVVTYPVTMRVRINRKDAILRELRRRILQAFEENAIPLGTDPANMLVMNHADPTAPPSQQPLTALLDKLKTGASFQRRPLITSICEPQIQTPPHHHHQCLQPAAFTGGWQVCPLHTTAKRHLCIFGNRGSVVSKTGGKRHHHLHPLFEPRHALVHRIPLQRSLLQQRAFLSPPITRTPAPAPCTITAAAPAAYVAAYRPKCSTTPAKVSSVSCAFSA